MVERSDDIEVTYDDEILAEAATRMERAIERKVPYQSLAEKLVFIPYLKTTARRSQPVGTKWFETCRLIGYLLYVCT